VEATPKLRTRSGLVGAEAIGAEPERSDGVKILFEGAGDIELFASLDAEDVVAGGPGLDFFDEGSVDEGRAVDADEAVGEEFFGDGGEGFAEEEVGAGCAVKQDVIALRFDGDDLGGIGEENAAVGFDGDSRAAGGRGVERREGSEFWS
jgi:hypothetical protein